MTEQEKIAEAVKEGYPDVDEQCPKCKTIFKNYHHFIRCNEPNCPMGDGKGTILDQIAKELEK